MQYEVEVVLVVVCVDPHEFSFLLREGEDKLTLTLPRRGLDRSANSHAHAACILFDTLGVSTSWLKLAQGQTVDGPGREAVSIVYKGQVACSPLTGSPPEVQLAGHRWVGVQELADAPLTEDDMAILTAAVNSL